MKHMTTLLVILISAGIVAAGCKKEDPDKTVKVYSIIGDVTITGTAGEKQAAVGDLLLAGDSVRTGENSMADILYGTAGVIRIQPGSSVAIATLMDQTTGDTQLDMPAGRMNVTLAKLKKGDFRVKTGTAVAAVRGTTFRITADDKATRLDVVTGAVKVNPVQNDTVVTTVEKTVEMNQAVELDEKAVKEAVEEKKEIAVVELKPEEVKEIREEVKDIKPEMLEKLNDDARKEVKEKILIADDSAEREREKQEQEKREKEKIEKEKIEKARAMKLLRDRRIREKAMRDRAEKEKQAPKQMEKKKSDEKSREGEPSTLPPSVNTL